MAACFGTLVAMQAKGSQPLPDLWFQMGECSLSSAPNCSFHRIALAAW